MTGPASAIKRRVDILIQAQIITLAKTGRLTEPELREYQARSERLKSLLRELDGRQPVRPYSTWNDMRRLRTAI